MIRHENCGGELVRRPGGNRECKKCKEMIYTGWDKTHFGGNGQLILPTPSLDRYDRMYYAPR